MQHLLEFPSQQSASRMTGEVFLLLLNWLLFSVSVYWLEQGTLTHAWFSHQSWNKDNQNQHGPGINLRISFHIKWHLTGKKNIPPPTTTMGCVLWMSWMKTTRSHWKQLLVNKRALKYIFKDKSASYQDLLQGIWPPSMETPKNPGHAIDNKQ